jgi:hypothetical protein
MFEHSEICKSKFRNWREFVSTAGVASIQHHLQTARHWIERLGGEEMCAQSWCANDSLAIGHFRFSPIEEEIEAPALPFHYVSLTLNGSLNIEASVGGKLAQLGSRLIDGFAKKMADDFFERFQQAVEGPAEGEDEAATAEAGGEQKKGWFKRLIS